jgi:hypothetical protein
MPAPSQPLRGAGRDRYHVSAPVLPHDRPADEALCHFLFDLFMRQLIFDDFFLFVS